MKLIAKLIVGILLVVAALCLLNIFLKLGLAMIAFLARLLVSLVPLLVLLLVAVAVVAGVRAILGYRRDGRRSRRPDGEYLDNLHRTMARMRRRIDSLETILNQDSRLAR